MLPSPAGPLWCVGMWRWSMRVGSVLEQWWGGGLSRRKQVIACGLWKETFLLFGAGLPEMLASSNICFIQVTFCTNTDRHVLNIRHKVKECYCEGIKIQVWNKMGQIPDNYLGLCLFTGMYGGRGMPAEFPASLIPHSLIYNWFRVSGHQAGFLATRRAVSPCPYAP